MICKFFPTSSKIPFKYKTFFNFAALQRVNFSSRGFHYFMNRYSGTKLLAKTPYFVLFSELICIYIFICDKLDYPSSHIFFSIRCPLFHSLFHRSMLFFTTYFYFFCYRPSPSSVFSRPAASILFQSPQLLATPCYFLLGFAPNLITIDFSKN